MEIVGRNGLYESAGPGASERHCDPGRENQANPLGDNAGMNTCDWAELAELPRKELNRHDRELWICMRRSGRIAHLSPMT